MLKNTKESFIENISQIQSSAVGDSFFVCDNIDDYRKRKQCFIITAKEIFFSGGSHADILKKIDDKSFLIFGNLINEQNVSVQEIVIDDNCVDLEKNIFSFKKQIRQYFPTANLYFSTVDLSKNSYFLTKFG